MNESLEETAGLYVLDQLDAAARADFEARLLREPDLVALVRELEAGLARGVRALPPVAPPAALFARIEEKIGSERWNPTSGRVGSSTAASVSEQPARPAGHRLGDGRRSGSTQSSPLWAPFARWGIAAVIAISLSVLAVQSLRRPAQPVFVVVGLDANRNTFTDLPQTSAAKDPDARFIQLASLAEDYWRKPGDAPVTPATANPGGNRGYALFDPGSQQGFIAIEQIPALAPNQRYHLWIADASTGRVRDAGTLPLEGLSRGLYSFALEPGGAVQSARPQLFVTAEEITPHPASEPRGKVVLGQRSF